MTRHIRIPIPLGPFRLVVHLLDIDPGDKDLSIGLGLRLPSGREFSLAVTLSWK